MTNVNWKSRIGEKKLMKCGMISEIIEAINWNDITVKFEDGYIKHSDYGSFKKGNINNPKAKFNRLNEINTNYQGLKMKIIRYNNSLDIDVEFEDGCIRYNVRYDHFKNGNIKSYYFPEILGVGYIGDDFSLDGKRSRSKPYACWKGMMSRCYDVKFQKEHSTYKGCVVCEEWKSYSNFEKWYNINYYELENERVELDKDILIKNNKIYSPNACIFVPCRINKMFRNFDSWKKKDGLPIGVYAKDDKFYSQIRIENKTICLGYYDTIEEAENIYNKKRFEEINKTIYQYKNVIPKEVYDKLLYTIKIGLW